VCWVLSLLEEQRYMVELGFRGEGLNRGLGHTPPETMSPIFGTRTGRPSNAAYFPAPRVLGLNSPSGQCYYTIDSLPS